MTNLLPTYNNILIGLAILAATLSFVLNLRAWRRKPPVRRCGLYFFGMATSLWFGLVYLLAFTGIVDFDLLVDSGLLRIAVILILLVAAFHAYVDT